MDKSTISGPRGTKIIRDAEPFDHGEGDIPNKNKAMPSSMKGSPEDLSRTLTGGGRVPGGSSD